MSASGTKQPLKRHVRKIALSLKRASSAVVPMSTVLATPAVRISARLRMAIRNPQQRSNRKRNSRAHRAQGAGCSPQRNKGGGRRPGDIRGGEYPVACARAPNKDRL